MNPLHEDRLAELRNIAVWMDSKFQGPFGWRYGLDPLIGLIPVLGDIVTTCFSVYILFQAAQLGCSSSVIGRMAVNIGIENVIGQLPIFGSIFDFVWKANNRNIQLLEAHALDPRGVDFRAKLFLAAILIGLLALIVGTASLMFYLMMMIFEAAMPYMPAMDFSI